MNTTVTCDGCRDRDRAHTVREGCLWWMAAHAPCSCGSGQETYKCSCWSPTATADDEPTPSLVDPKGHPKP